MINFLVQSGAIAPIGFIFFGASAIAEPDAENSSDVLKPTENEVR